MLDIARAQACDIDRIIELRHNVEEWLASRQIVQWTPREIPDSVFCDQVAAGEYYVARLEGLPGIVGACRLLWADRALWQDEAFAGYVHGLVVDRAHAGTGIGGALLDWAGRTARAAGADRLRLDCVDTNTALCAYYRAAGFIQVGHRSIGASRGVALFQRTLTEPLICDR
ncbi:GNAT family N-acetyltransferase [Nocardia vermiculata]|uniref:GNAT family N-acetyltransferase n=1 Tax=Nocardia vermiculata TaxID=257274 RepID=A0A846Y5Y6_9NOCA|nr:GNAT family N-acetyltransferase [Nocardia vermiculata]NKY53244.1 GNAT family N-acetyltransferase [Nocardia vermiculata]